jgi:hypothetical protein
LPVLGFSSSLTLNRLFDAFTQGVAVKEYRSARA